MAIGDIVSHRNFGSFIGFGRLQHGEAATYHPGGPQQLNVAAARYVCRMIDSKLRHSCTRYSCNQSSLHARDQLNIEFYRSCSASHFRVDPPLFTYDQVINTRRRVKGLYQCCLSFAYSDGNWVRARKLSNLGFLGALKPLSKHSTVARTTADFKSEEYDVTSTNLNSILSPDGANEVVLVEEVEHTIWKQFPKRYVMVLLCFTAFLLCNMDRVNMSIAILPMSKEFNWNSATVGLIQSSFFWGYLLTQIVGGIWADEVGGKLVLGFGVVWWSLATVLTPIAARMGLPFLLTMRAFMGIGEGVAMPAMNNLMSKWIPVPERSRSLALVYSGMYLGSVTGLAVSPVLVHKFGWPSVFYSFGSVGSIWFALWWSKAHSSPKDDPNLSPNEKELILGNGVGKEAVSEIPWKKILTKGPVWALIISHFCHNWGTFILLTWMPTYYNQVVGLPIPL